MKKQTFIKELSNYCDTSGIKVRFYEKSPYMARRLKEKYINWEAWLYNGKAMHGFLVTGDDWNVNETQNKLLVDSFIH